MPDPIVTTPVLKKLLSLNTPVALRIFEIALLLGLIVVSAYLGEQLKQYPIIYVATGIIETFGTLLLMAMVIGLFITIMKELTPDKKE
jgi:hypothetical protein